MLLSTTRLFESPIWQLQKQAYARLGVGSWAQGRVPFQITNNARIAAQYVDIICDALPKTNVTILELGGGSGKFAFLVLKEFARRQIFNVHYILTDAADKNIAFWNSHPLFKKWIDQNILQTTVIDPLSMHLPTADLVIANYFFDSIPHDLFRIENGQIFEGIVSLHAERESLDWDDPTLLSQLKMTYAFRPLKNNPYPEFPEAWAVLQEYGQRFKDFSFVFPIGALETIRAIGSSTKKGFLMLAADRGPSSEQELMHIPLMPTFHGTAFSFPVNFDAIGCYIKKMGGEIAFSRSQETDFAVVLLSSKSSISTGCFESKKFGPLKRDATDFTSILCRLEEAHWDVNLFFSWFDHIQELFGDAKESEKNKMLVGMRRVKDQFFPMFREEGILLERLGLFFRSLGDEAEAILHFELASSFQDLSTQGFNISAFLETKRSLGRILQIGDREGAFKAIETIQSSLHVYVPWNAPISVEGLFDTIFLFPPRIDQNRKQPSFIREIEQQFSLDTMRYSDNDIEMFFSAVNQGADPKHILHFFIELERKKNISRDQLEKIATRLGMDRVYEEQDRFFETLMICLEKHMQSGSILYAFLPGIITYENPKFFEAISVNPHVETEEIREPEGTWVTVRKL